VGSGGRLDDCFERDRAQRFALVKGHDQDLARTFVTPLSVNWSGRLSPEAGTAP
jgi:hypothetical protein